MRHLMTVLTLLFAATVAAAQRVDERPGGAGEWGFHPADGYVSPRNPPSFSWRPQEGARSYTLQIARHASFDRVEYEASGIKFNVHCPTRTLLDGDWFWRFRFVDEDGTESNWSSTRQFSLATDANVFVLPSREELLAHVPDSHPRLFLRPEQIPQLRQRLETTEADAWAALLKKCDNLLKTPPPTDEPPKYDADMVRGSDPWRAVWWGNRTYTIALLDSAATLGFAYVMTGDERFGLEAKRLLMAAAEWDPRGSTGYRYNDEAGMPYAYHFSRTYTFVHDLLSAEERAKCRDIMTVRGNEMYRHLHPNHLWRPYSSHSNRAWHFLGEVAIAFHDEIPQADDWLWFAVNVFANVYPVWSDSDGGWHEGVNYWQSYLGRFTWWADVMREAVGLNAYDLPYFSQAGYYGMYMMPPGMTGGGFGDLNARMTSERLQPLMTTLATQAANPHWQWYVEQHGGASWPNDYISLLRRARSAVDPESPIDLPSSKLFRGTGQAVLNSNLLDANDNIRILFKSSPFGTQSHGYEAQNAFILSAFGKPLLIRSGYRDSYGSDHHRNWMWETESVNSVLVDGKGQTPHSARATGEIIAFHTSAEIDYVEGEAANAYDNRLESFRRGMLFIKPDIVLIIDRLVAKQPATFQWLLHAPNEMEFDDDHIHVRNGDAACVVRLIGPGELETMYTDQFDPPPRSRIQLTEYHFTASTTEPSRRAAFLAIIRPHHSDESAPPLGELRQGDPDEWVLDIPRQSGRAVVRISRSTGQIDVMMLDTDGQEISRWTNR